MSKTQPEEPVEQRLEEAVHAASEPKKTTSEDVWERFNKALGKFTENATLLSHETASQALMACAHLKKDGFNTYMSDLFPEEEPAQEEKGKQGGGWLSGVVGVVGSIARRFSSSGPSKKALEKSLRDLSVLLDDLRDPETEGLHGQLQQHMVLASINVIGVDPQTFTDAEEKPVIESDVFNQMLSSLVLSGKEISAQYLQDNEKPLKDLLKKTRVKVREVFELHASFSKEKLTNDPIETLSVLLAKTAYSPKKLIKYARVLPWLFEHCDALGGFCHPRVIRLRDLAGLQQEKKDVLVMHADAIKMLFIFKGIQGKTFLTFESQLMAQLAQCVDFFFDVSHSVVQAGIKDPLKINKQIKALIVSLDDEKRAFLVEHKGIILALCRRQEKSFLDLACDFDSLEKSVTDELARKKAFQDAFYSVVRNDFFELKEKAYVLAALRKNDLSDQEVDSLFSSFSERRKKAILARDIQGEQKRPASFFSSLRADPNEQKNSDDEQAVDAKIAKLKKGVVSLKGILATAEESVKRLFLAYITLDYFSILHEIDAASDDGIIQPLGVLYDSDYRNAMRVPKALLNQGDAIRDLVQFVGLDQLVTFFQRLKPTDRLHQDIRLLQTIHNKMGYSVDDIFANPKATIFVTNHVDVLQEKINATHYPLALLEKLAAQEDGTLEISSDELKRLIHLDRSSKLPLSILLKKSPRGIRFMATDSFVEAAIDLAKEADDPAEDAKLCEAQPFDPATGALLESDTLTLLTIPEDFFALVQEKVLTLRQLLALPRVQADYLKSNLKAITSLQAKLGVTLFELIQSFESLKYVVGLTGNDDDPKSIDVRWLIEEDQRFLLRYTYRHFSEEHDSSDFFQSKMLWLRENREQLTSFLENAYEGVQISQMYAHTPEMQRCFFKHPPKRINDGEAETTYNRFCRALWAKGSADDRAEVPLQEPFDLLPEKHWLYKKPGIILYVMQQGVSWGDVTSLENPQLKEMYRACSKADELIVHLNTENDLNHPKALKTLRGLKPSLVVALKGGVQAVADVLQESRTCRMKFRPRPIRWGLLAGTLSSLAVFAPVVTAWVLPTFVLSSEALTALPSGLLIGVGVVLALLCAAGAGYTSKKTHDHRCRKVLLSRSESEDPGVAKAKVLERYGGYF